MFCTNCGTTIPEDSSFCPGCGANINAAQTNAQQQAPVYQQAPIQQQAPIYQQAPIQQQAPIYQQAPTYQQAPVYQQGPYPQKPSKKKGWIVALIIAIVAIVAIGGLVFVLIGSKNKSPEDIVEKIEQAYNKQDLDCFYKCLPDFVEQELKDEFNDYYDSEEEFWDEIFSYDTDWELKAISSYKVTFDIDDKVSGDKDDCEELEEEIEYYYDEKVSISEAYGLEIDVTYDITLDRTYLKQYFGNDYDDTLSYYYDDDWKNGIEETTSVNAIIYKSNGRWYLYYYDGF